MYTVQNTRVNHVKIDRLIGIITILLQQTEITVPELAARFEVSRRTINRDIEDICKAGIPLVTTQGYGGGISIAEGYKIDRSVLTEEELLLIFSGLQGVDSVLKTPQFKVLAEKLPVKDLDGDMIIDLASHYQTPLAQKAALIKSAIQSRHILSFRYYYEKGECQRKIEPYKLVFQWSSWYVWGYCLERKAFRLFKLNRLSELACIPEPFAPRELPLQELDFHRHLTEGTLYLKALFDKSETYRLIEEYGVGCYSEYGEALLFERNFVSYQHMRQWVLSFGNHVEVIEPVNLQAELRQVGEDFLRKYGDT